MTRRSRYACPSEALNKARVYLDEVVPDFAALQRKWMNGAGTRLFQVDNHIFAQTGKIGKPKR